MTLEQTYKEHANSAGLEKLSILAAKASKAASSAAYHIKPHPELRHQPFTMSDMQQAYWIGRDTELGGGGVAMQGYMEIDCPSLDTGRLERALELLVARHDMLRAVVLEDGRQKVLPLPLRLAVQQEDLSALSPEQQRERLQATGDAMCAVVSDLTRWPQSEIRFSRLSSDGKGRLHFRLDQWATDGRSFQIIIEDLITLYHDPEAELPSLGVTFQDYMLALEEHKKSDEYKSSAAYWQKRLKTLPQSPQLPKKISDTVTKDDLNSSGVTRRSDSLTEEETRNLHKACAMRGLSMPSVLGAVYGELLAHWSGSDHFTLNAPRFNRNLHWHPDLNNIVGEFATFTLLEFDNTAGVNIQEKAEAFQNEIWESLEYGHVSGMYLLRELARERGTIDTEVMPIIFTAMPDRKIGDNKFEQLLATLGTLVRMYGSTPQTRLDYIFTVFDNKLHIYWDSRDATFPDGMVDDMFQEFMRILRLLTVSEEAWKKKGLVQTPSYQQAQRIAVLEPEQELPETTVFELFMEQAGKIPNNAAVITWDQRVTYQELLAGVLKIRDELLKILPVPIASPGAATQVPESPSQMPQEASVAIVMHRGWQAIAAVLAVQAAGFPYMPLDVSNPPSRLQMMLSTGNAKAVITESSLAHLLENFPAPTIDIEKHNLNHLTKGSFKHSRGTTSLPSPDSAAYVLLTSGTTGTPKAVTASHKGLLNTVLYSNRRFAVTETDRFIAITALHHDMSVYDIFGALSTGAALVIPPHDKEHDPDTWIELIQRENVSIWNSVPGFHNALMERCLERGKRLPLRLQMLGGDWVLPDTLEKIEQVSPGSQFYSLGGPTETTVWNIMYQMKGLPEGWNTIPYGAPIMNNVYHLLNERLADVPDWVPGEMYCSGVGVCMRTTAAQNDDSLFAVHPETGERLYRTGDLGRYHPDGLIEILGRKDFQLNIGGYRFDPGEVEKVLALYPGILRGVLVPVQTSVPVSAHNPDGYHATHNGALVLGAYIVSKEKKLSEGELTDYLQQHFPLQMIPRIWAFGDEPPLTVNGKFDRKAIAGLVAKAVSTQIESEKTTDALTPQTPLEHFITGIWEEILNIKLPHLQANFFKYGGDSLKAIQIINRIKAHLPVQLPLTAFFSSPTPMGIINAVLGRIAAQIDTTATKRA